VETCLSGDFEVFINDGRDGKNTDSFYDILPELEIEAKCFVADAILSPSTFNHNIKHYNHNCTDKNRQNRVLTNGFLGPSRDPIHR